MSFTALLCVLAVWVGRRSQNRLRPANDRTMVDRVKVDRLLIVRADHLDDLCELARAAADRLPEHDPLPMALRGAIAQVRADAIPEP